MTWLLAYMGVHAGRRPAFQPCEMGWPSMALSRYRATMNEDTERDINLLYFVDWTCVWEHAARVLMVRILDTTMASTAM